MAIYHPPTILNSYIQDKIMGASSFALPMYPTMPTDLSAATDGFTMAQLIGNDTNTRYTFNGALAIYDRMFRMRKTPFPYIKCEQVLYYFYSIDEAAVQTLFETTQLIQDLLDRGDDSAKDLNDWTLDLHASQGSRRIAVTDVASGEQELKPVVTIRGEDFLLPYFHNIKIYQLQETRDIIDFATARTYAGNKIIIDYDWHKSE